MTAPLNKPLSDDELDFLDAFLLDRFDDEVDALGRDEGVLCVSELDGLLTAIVCSPVTVMPSRWLPAVWGDFPPAFEELADVDRVTSLLFRHMNGIAIHLIEEPETFEPMFLAREWDGETALVVDEWCEGFMRGVALASDAWNAGGSVVLYHLMKILAFCEAGGWTGHDSDDHFEVEQRQLAIAPTVRTIHAYWLERRQADIASDTYTLPIRRTEPRVGRNDPCPCGSGKKYRKCCLQ